MNGEELSKGRCIPIKFTIIPVGQFDSDWSVLSPKYPLGRRAQIPIYCYLIDTTNGLLLFDTGCSHQCRQDPAQLLGEETIPIMTPRLTSENHIEAQLKKLNLTPKDIDLVVNSHCHFDHAGGNQAFPDNAFGIQQQEYEAALADRDSYPDRAFQPGNLSRLTLFQGDTELVPGAMLISTPGHTLGHQSLVVTLHDGPILITSDAVYTREHFSLENLGAAKDITLAHASLQRLMQLAQDGMRPFFSHDPDQVREEGWQLAPFWYE